MIANIIQFVLSNFTLTFLVMGLVVAAIRLALQKSRSAPEIIEAFFSCYLIFLVGLTSLYGFATHVFFGDMAASFIGWAPSPFQLEVGFASLGFGVLGLMAPSQGLGFRAATVIGPAMFLWGAAGGHVYQMATAHNFAPGNAGTIFWSDILIPLFGFALLFLQSRHPVRR